MKKPPKEVQEWLQFAGEDLQAAEVLFKAKIYNQSAFHSQQSAEKVLKACLLFKGEHLPRIHDLNELLEKAIRSGFVSLISFREKIGDLNLFYAPTRYLDAAIGTLPDRMPNEEDARNALKTADEVYRLVFKDLSSFIL